jgi:hypothetical protein
MVGNGTVPSFVLRSSELLLGCVGWWFGHGLKGSLGGVFGVLSLGCSLFAVDFL